MDSKALAWSLLHSQASLYTTESSNNLQAIKLIFLLLCNWFTFFLHKIALNAEQINSQCLRIMRKHHFKAHNRNRYLCSTHLALQRYYFSLAKSVLSGYGWFPCTRSHIILFSLGTITFMYTSPDQGTYIFITDSYWQYFTRYQESSRQIRMTTLDNDLVVQPLPTMTVYLILLSMF